VRIKNLASLKKAASREIILAELPETIRLTHFANAKAFKINELVRSIHQQSFEWYGFTLALREAPELVIDLGLPVNEQNREEYVSVEAEKIAAYRDSLPDHLIINGWIHSHGDLSYRHFSPTDATNQAVVLDYVTAGLRQPVAKVEIAIQDFVFLCQGSYRPEDLRRGSVSLITDSPVTRASLWETVYGGFCYAIVIGDEGWHEQEIHYKRRGILTGQTSVGSKKDAELVLIDDGRLLTNSDIEMLGSEISSKLSPVTSVPPKLESM